MTLTLATSRLVLRPVVEGDLPWFHPLHVEPGVRRYLLDDAVWSAEEVRERLLQPNAALWAREGVGLLAVLRDGAPVGWCGFWYFHEPPVRELAYALHPSAWGQGVAVEAAIGVLGWAMGRGDRVFHASTDAPNVASIRVLERLGFREVRRTPGARHETVHFAGEGDPGWPRAVTVTGA